MVIWKHLSACLEHSNCTRNAFASESDWHFNGDLEHQSAFREHSNCAEMHVLLSQIGKHMHSNGHLENQKCIS